MTGDERRWKGASQQLHAIGIPHGDRYLQPVEQVSSVFSIPDFGQHTDVLTAREISNLSENRVVLAHCADIDTDAKNLSRFRFQALGAQAESREEEKAANDD
jgi:hypothetical protein